jgi:hypothetical protein
MHALDFEGELLFASRNCPTLPAPPARESGVCLQIARVPWFGATVDVVVCDLSRDPRSEDFDPAKATLSSDRR